MALSYKMCLVKSGLHRQPVDESPFAGGLLCSNGMEKNQGQVIENSEQLVACVGWYRRANLRRTLEKGGRCPRQHFYVVPNLRDVQLHHIHLKGLKRKDTCLLENEGY